MKKLNLCIALLGACLLISSTYSCDEKSTSDSVGKTICTSAEGACGGSFQACANTSSAWYTYNGKKYPCSSTSNCTAAATALATDMTKSCKISKTEFNQKVNEILSTYPMIK